MHDPGLRTTLAVIALAVAATAVISLLPAALGPAPAVPVATVRPGPSPTATAKATPGPTPSATAFATELVAGPGVACCFAQAGRWSSDVRGAPVFDGPSRWTNVPTATAQWSLGGPAGGGRWDAVRVQAWIPDQHGVAWVRYTVTSTDGPTSAVRTFDVPQQSYTGWYALPGTFRIGTATRRTGTITVRMALLSTAQGMVGGAEMAAAQVRFQWS